MLFIINTLSGPDTHVHECRGLLHINSTITGPYGHMLDTYLDYRGWNKGLVFVNGFNLGWYWPRKGPQNTQYIPGPLLHYGTNEIVLLEIEPMTVKEPAGKSTYA